MARTQIQLMLTDAEWQQAQIQDPNEKGVSSDSMFRNLGLDSVKMQGVQIRSVAYRPERGGVWVLIDHPGYPEVAKFDEAPAFPLDAGDSLYPAEVAVEELPSPTSTPEVVIPDPNAPTGSPTPTPTEPNPDETTGDTSGTADAPAVSTPPTTTEESPTSGS